MLLPAALQAAVPTAAQAAAPTAAPQASWIVLALAMLLGAALCMLTVAALHRLRSTQRTAALQRMVDAAADWTWQADTVGRVWRIDPAGRRPTSVDWLQLQGRPFWQLAGIPEAPLPIAQAMRARAPFHDVPLAVDSVNETRHFVLSGVPTKSADGQFTGYTGIGRDVTDLTRALAGCHASAGPEQADLERLRREHSERTRQLEVAVRELDGFAHSVSHDLRAPLRVVDGFATILLEDYAETGRPLDDLARDHIRRIVAAGQRMNSMIDTLLALSRMTNRELSREHVDLTQLAHELADELRSQEPGRHIEFAVASGLAADGDRTLLRLVLQNLMGNAFKFTARSAAARIEVACREDRGNTVYFVRDNGAGFDMRFAEKMFGLFQRFHSANEFPGTGVGLATVQRIVRKHGGRIWAEGRPGEGATFSFTLWERIDASAAAPERLGVSA